MMEIQWILLRNIVKSFDIIYPTIDERSLEAELVSLLVNKAEGRILFAGIVKSDMVSYSLFTKMTD